MRKIILMVHLSLDDYVAGPQGDLGYFVQHDDNLAYVNRLTAGADAALFGRNSYQLLDNFWPEKHQDQNATQAEKDYSNWYNAAQKLVVSSTLPDSNESGLTLIIRDPENELKEIKEQKGGDILIFGSPALSETLMKADLIDAFYVFIHPAFFGQGLPLFGHLPNKRRLELLKTDLLPNGEIVAIYKS